MYMGVGAELGDQVEFGVFKRVGMQESPTDEEDTLGTATGEMPDDDAALVEKVESIMPLEVRKPAAQMATVLANRDASSPSKAPEGGVGI